MALLGCLAFAVPGTALTVVVGAQWLMLSVGSGLSSPNVVLGAFGLGAPVSIIAALALGRGLGLGAVGYLYGFGIGQLCTLVLLLVGVMRVLPANSDERGGSGRPSSSTSSSRRLPSLTTCRLADKPILWLLSGRQLAALYTASAALSWFSVIPAFAWIYVQIETVFYQRTARSTARSRGAVRSRSETTLPDRSRRGAAHLAWRALVQGGVTLVALMAGPLVLRVAGLPAAAVPMYRFALIGAAMQLGTLLTLLLLYYFDLRRNALTVAVVLLVGEVTFTVVCWRAGLPPGLGYVLASTASCLLGINLVRRRMRTLLVDTFQSQPFGAM